MLDTLFNPHGSRTADGVRIVPGLWVWTNDMTQGQIIGDQTATAEVGCCVRNGAEGHDSPAQTRDGFVDHELATHNRDSGCYCGHDHWFTVATVKGTVSMNGERLGRRMQTLGLAEAQW